MGYTPVTQHLGSRGRRDARDRVRPVSQHRVVYRDPFHKVKLAKKDVNRASL